MPHTNPSSPAGSSAATQPRPAFTVCVYCGSRPGSDPAYAQAAQSVGRLLGERGWGLVYGGGRAGLMGVVADAALAAGGHVTGVIPQTLIDRELGHGGVQELHIVQTMHERKRMMAERADAFVALPGGIGTFEELFEVWTWRQLGYHDKPVGLLEVSGYYAPLLAFLQSASGQGFMTPEQHALLRVSDSPVDLLDRLHADASRAVAPDDYRRI